MACGFGLQIVGKWMVVEREAVSIYVKASRIVPFVNRRLFEAL